MSNTDQPAIVYTSIPPLAPPPTPLIKTTRLPPAHERRAAEAVQQREQHMRAWESALMPLNQEEEEHQRRMRDLSQRIRSKIKPIFRHLQMLVLLYLITALLWLFILILVSNRHWREWAFGS